MPEAIEHLRCGSCFGGWASRDPGDRELSNIIVSGTRAFQKGFTLMELLAVMSIIGVLACLLLASVFNAKEESRSATCKSPLRQIRPAR